MPQDPAELIRNCLREDRHACEILFEQYRALVFRTAYLMFGNAHDAEDALQEVFLQVFRSLRTYDPARSAFSTWLHRVTVNYCLRSRRLSERLEVAPLSGVEHLDSHSSDDPHDVLALAEQADWLLGKLNEDQRAIVILRFYWGLAYQEIAEIVGVELGTVQSRLGRALKKMRLAMQAMTEEAR